MMEVVITRYYVVTCITTHYIVITTYYLVITTCDGCRYNNMLSRYNDIQWMS